MFQSTRPRRARHHMPSSPSINFSVSIHAPTQGATARANTTAPYLVKFQSTRPRRARRGQRAGYVLEKKFQSTRPRGGRRRSALQRLMGHFVSIHAPTQGATTAMKVPSGSSQFQSTRPRRARHCQVQHALALMTVSIHAPTQGATLLPAHDGRRSWFQSTRPRRARLSGLLLLPPPAHRFNPRAHAGRDSFCNVF